MKRCEIRFYYSCQKVILVFILLSSFFFIADEILLEIMTSNDGLSKILLFLTFLSFSGLWLWCFYVTSKIIYFQWQKTPYLILNEKGLNVRSILKKWSFFIPWQEINYIYIYAIRFAGNRYIYIEPIFAVGDKYGKKRWINLYSSNLHINEAHLRDHVQDVFEVLEDYWQTNGEYDEEIIAYLHDCRKRRKQKKIFWFCFLSFSLLFCFWLVSQK